MVAGEGGGGRRGGRAFVADEFRRGRPHGDAAAICLAVGGCVAVIGVAAFAVRRLLQRPASRIAMRVPPALPFVAASPGFRVRAGPPPLLQVFRL